MVLKEERDKRCELRGDLDVENLIGGCLNSHVSGKPADNLKVSDVLDNS